MKRFNWQWIKSQYFKCEEARILVKFSNLLNSEPHRFAGKQKIFDWLDNEMADRFLYNLVIELEVVWHNINSMQFKRILTRVGSKEKARETRHTNRKKSFNTSQNKVVFGNKEKGRTKDAARTIRRNRVLGK